MTDMIVRDGGLKAEDFGSYKSEEEGGKVYMKLHDAPKAEPVNMKTSRSE
jgi:hypothetical protein